MTSKEFLIDLNNMYFYRSEKNSISIFEKRSSFYIYLNEKKEKNERPYFLKMNAYHANKSL